jgi:hypothetical protein
MKRILPLQNQAAYRNNLAEADAKIKATTSLNLLLEASRALDGVINKIEQRDFDQRNSDLASQLDVIYETQLAELEKHYLDQQMMLSKELDAMLLVASSDRAARDALQAALEAVEVSAWREQVDATQAGLQAECAQLAQRLVEATEEATIAKQMKEKLLEEITEEHDSVITQVCFVHPLLFTTCYFN